MIGDKAKLTRMIIIDGAYKICAVATRLKSPNSFRYLLFKDYGIFRKIFQMIKFNNKNTEQHEI